jgi:uncharacterized membrane protein YbhN (UPF0104 family)
VEWRGTKADDNSGVAWNLFEITARRTDIEVRLNGIELSRLEARANWPATSPCSRIMKDPPCSSVAWRSLRCGRRGEQAIEAPMNLSRSEQRDSQASPAEEEHPPGASRVFQGLTLLVTLAAVSLAGFLLHRTLSRYDVAEIVASVAAISPERLVLAAAFAAASYLCLTGFDALALRYNGHPLPYRRIALASFAALSIGHNIGLAALSSGAIRYRYYSRWGLSAGEVGKLIVFCAVTVALGLAVLGGVAILLRPALAEETTRLGRPGVLGLGAACLALSAGYVALAALRRAPLRLWRWSLKPPGLPLALGQVAVGAANFAFVAACLHQALSANADLPYLGVAAVYVIANVAGIVSHVPGGLGVLESVVLVLLPQEPGVVAALVVFRAVYFLVPLGLGILLFFGSELMLRRTKAAQAQDVQQG